MSIQRRIGRILQQGSNSSADSTASPPAVEPPGSRPETPLREPLLALRMRFLPKIIASLDPKLSPTAHGEIRLRVEEQTEKLLAEEGIVISRSDRQRLIETLLAEIIGYGPIEPLLRDDTVDEIMVNGPGLVYVERRGKIEEVSTRFDSPQHVMRIIERIVSPLGRRVDETQPYVDARLPDGSRVNVIIPPLALDGPTITIRKFAKRPLTTPELIEKGTFTAEFVELIKACVQGKLNILISGGTGTGKTTLLNVISAFIHTDERILTIEDAAELQLRQKHVIRLETRPPNIEGRGEVTRRDLVINALRMRPDRILIGEVRGGEALDMLQAMNTGHEGSMTTVHANSPRDALHRLETMVLMAGFDLPLRAIREQISSALDLIIQLDRARDGVRRVVSVVEIQAMEGDVVVTQEIFRFEATGVRDGQTLGTFRPTGIRPKFTEKLEKAGLFLPPKVFGLDARMFG